MAMTTETEERDCMEKQALRATHGGLLWATFWVLVASAAWGLDHEPVTNEVPWLKTLVFFFGTVPLVIALGAVTGRGRWTALLACIGFGLWVALT